MGQEQLNCMIILYVHKDIPLTYSQIVDLFAAKAPRLMTLTDPMDHQDDQIGHEE